MNFRLNRDGIITLRNGETEVRCTVAELQSLEPGFEHTPGDELWSAEQKYLTVNENQGANPYDRSAYLTAEKLSGYQAALAPEPEPEPEPRPKWDAALVTIHQALAGQTATDPFVQIWSWGKAQAIANNPVLKLEVSDFSLAFGQPLVVRFGAVQSGLNNVWAALTTQQQADLNKTAIAAWNTAHYLGLALPWEA